MFLLLARWLHKTHRNCTIIARSSTNTVDLNASIWPQTTRFNTRLEYSSLATATAQQCNTCYGRDGSIASGSINREKNIEARVIFKKIQFALGSPNRYEFYSGAKKKVSCSGKSDQEHVPHFLHKKWIFTSGIKPGSLRSYRSVKVNSVCWWASDYCAVAIGFVEPASKKQEHTLPAD